MEILLIIKWRLKETYSEEQSGENQPEGISCSDAMIMSEFTNSTVIVLVQVAPGRP